MHTTSKSLQVATIPAYLYTPVVLEGFLCGIYSGILALYLQCHAAPTGRTCNTKKNILYAICVLYILSVVSFALNLLVFALQVQSLETNSRFQYVTVVIQAVVFGCCDFIAQSILIYRCWIVWGCNIRVIIVPSILALAYLGTWLAADGASIIKEDAIRSSIEENTVISGLLTTTATISSLVISMAVNALVTGLIVWRILKVLREVQGSISARKSSGAIGLRGSSLIFVISESGVALFSVQLIRVIFTLPQFLLIKGALDFIVVTHQMLNGITPTIILVRVSMGLSFGDKRSSEEITLSLHFEESDGPSSSRQEWRDNDSKGSELEDIQVMEINGGTIVQSNQTT